MKSVANYDKKIGEMDRNQVRFPDLSKNRFFVHTF